MSLPDTNSDIHSNTNADTIIEPASFREALGHFASSITIITTQVDDEPIGFTCQSFYSVSMNPPLVSFSVKASSFSYPKIRQAERFAVNNLSSEQSHVSNQFAMRGAAIVVFQGEVRGFGWGRRIKLEDTDQLKPSGSD